MANPIETSIDGLSEAFRATGLEVGDHVIAHSAYRSLGGVEDGPRGVIKALLQVIGSSGNLMLPTFNYAPADRTFDPDETPGLTGIIPELGRKWPGAIRSLHPSHSVAVIGPDAEALTAGHLDCRTVGIGSPVDRLAKIGGKVLLIGVSHTSNTTAHVAAEYAGIPSAPWDDGLPVIDIKMRDGSVIQHQLDTSTACSCAFNAVECPLRENGFIRDNRIGGCLMQLVRGQDVIDTVCAMLAEHPDILLCTAPGCTPCNGTRENLRRMGRIGK